MSTCARAALRRFAEWQTRVFGRACFNHRTYLYTREAWSLRLMPTSKQACHKPQRVCTHSSCLLPLVAAGALGKHGGVSCKCMRVWKGAYVCVLCVHVF
jgi:hypothetical protein